MVQIASQSKGKPIMIEATPRLQIHELQKYSFEEILSVISKEPGIYICWSKEHSDPAYIGVALNRRGLFGRVVCQHLNPVYLELRTEKTENASMFAMYKERKAIEKSVFRKKIWYEKYEKGTDLFYGVWGHLNNLTTGGWKGDGLFQPFRNSIRNKRSGTKDENEMQSAPECSMTVYRTIRQKFNDPGIDTLPVSGSLCCEALM